MLLWMSSRSDMIREEKVGLWREATHFWFSGTTKVRTEAKGDETPWDHSPPRSLLLSLSFSTYQPP